MRLSASSCQLWRVSMFLMLFPWTSIVEPSISPISNFCDSANLCLKNDVQIYERKVIKLQLFFGFIKTSLKLDCNVCFSCIIFLSGTKAFLRLDLSKHLMGFWTSYRSGQITTVFAYLKALVTVWDKHTARSPSKTEFCVTALCTRTIRSLIKYILSFPVMDISTTTIESTWSSCINLLLAVLLVLPFGFARDKGAGLNSYVRIFLKSTVRQIAITTSLWNIFLLQGCIFISKIGWRVILAWSTNVCGITFFNSRKKCGSTIELFWHGFANFLFSD